MYYFNAILLDECPYSINAKRLLEQYNINHKIIIVTQHNKEKYKNDKIKTFPQIYLKKENSVGNVLIGGYDELNSLINLSNNKKFNNDIVNSIMNKYKISKKTSLRLYQLINNIKISK